jgi:hypothetical protein
MLGEAERRMMEEVRQGLERSIADFPLEGLQESIRGNADLMRMKGQLERLIGGLTPHEPFYEFCVAAIAFCNEHMTMMRLLEGSIRGMKGAQKRFLQKTNDILEGK